MLPAAISAPTPTTHVDVRFDAVRSSNGLIRACLTHNPAYFPWCDKDPQAHKLSIPAAPGASLSFADVGPGDYAIAVLHDENRNGKMDKLLGLPREGIGFSRNPVIRTGPPAFGAVEFPVGAQPVAETIRMQYFL